MQKEHFYFPLYRRRFCAAVLLSIYNIKFAALKFLKHYCTISAFPVWSKNYFSFFQSFFSFLHCHLLFFFCSSHPYHPIMESILIGEPVLNAMSDFMRTYLVHLVEAIKTDEFSARFNICRLQVKTVLEMDYVLKHRFNKESIGRDEGHGKRTFEFYEAKIVYKFS